MLMNDQERSDLLGLIRMMLVMGLTRITMRRIDFAMGHDLRIRTAELKQKDHACFHEVRAM